MPPDDLPLVLRALGIGLAVEALTNPVKFARIFIGDFVELLVTLLRDPGSAKPH